MPELAGLTSEPLLLALALFTATFVAEDAATIAAGVLVGTSGVDPALALGSVILGTAFGDLTLYGIGRWGAATAIGAKLRRREDVNRLLSAFARHMLGLLIIARFVPGMRLPVFTASGIAQAPTRLVSAVVLLTTPIWTSLLFEVSRRAGAGATDDLIGTTALGGLVVTGLMFVPRNIAKRLMK